MTSNKVDRLVSYGYVAPNRYIYLLVYVYTVVILDNDKDDTTELKQHLSQIFQTKDLGRLDHFLCIGVAQFISGSVISQYVLDILEET